MNEAETRKQLRAYYTTSERYRFADSVKNKKQELVFSPRLEEGLT